MGWPENLMRKISKPKIDLDAARNFAAVHLPGAEVRNKFGGASFFVAGKVFAFTRPKGLVLKLPQPAIEELIASREVQPLTMGKRTMREWVVVPLQAGDYTAEFPLLRSAMQYVRILKEG
jgi:TfoX N-terminal domain